LSTAIIYTKFDLKDTYNRVRIYEGDEWKTTLRTHYRHFEYIVIPMGLANMPVTFQTYINQAMVGVNDVSCIVYWTTGDMSLWMSELPGANR
jgi:hypothetical protein